MDKLIWFFAGMLSGSVVFYLFAGLLISQYRELHERAIEVYSGLHRELVAALSKVEQKASNVEKALTS